MSKQTQLYHDYSTVIEQDLEEIARQYSVEGAKKMRRGPRGGVTTPFPVKLHQLLEEDSYPDVISWQPHGRCFILRKPNEFLNDVMPQHFKQTKLTSFQRQLNLYAFRRISSGPDKGAYYHELFLRGKSSLCHHIFRLRVKGTKTKSASCPEKEPNFYLLPPLDASTSHDNKYISEDETLSYQSNQSKHQSRSGSFDNTCSDSSVAISNAYDHGHNSDRDMSFSRLNQHPPVVISQANNPAKPIYDTNQDKAVEFAGMEFFYLDPMDHWDACALPFDEEKHESEIMGLSIIDGELCGFDRV